jgi:hypothetical protein
MRRPLVDASCGPNLDQLPQVHDADPVSQVPHHRQVVRDDDVRQITFTLQPFHEVQDLRLNRNIQCRHWLVGDDQPRLDGQGAREANPLSLAARELVRVELKRSARKAHFVQQLSDASVLLGLGTDVLCSEWLA